MRWTLTTSSAGTVSQVEKWEYISLRCDGPTMETTLTELGEEGWEAVGFAPVVHQEAGRENSLYGFTWVTKWTTAEYRVLLKRRKP